MLYAVPWNFEKEKGHMMNGKTLVLFLAFELKSTTSIVKKKIDETPYSTVRIQYIQSVFWVSAMEKVD